MINKNFQYRLHCTREKNLGKKCLSVRNVSGLGMSQGWTYLWCLQLLLYKKAEKERLRSKSILGLD